MSERIYVARDRSGDVYVYDTKPSSYDDGWYSESASTRLELDHFNPMFSYLKWKDEPLEFRIHDSKEPEPKEPETNTLYTQHKAITQELHETYVAKNKDYGNSFGETYKELGKISALTRILDKINRLKQLSLTDEVHVNDESLVDTIKDAANYLIMYAMELENETSSDLEGDRNDK